MQTTLFRKFACDQGTAISRAANLQWRHYLYLPTSLANLVLSTAAEALTYSVYTTSSHESRRQEPFQPEPTRALRPHGYHFSEFNGWAGLGPYRTACQSMRWDHL